MGNDVAFLRVESPKTNLLLTRCELCATLAERNKRGEFVSQGLCYQAPELRGHIPSICDLRHEPHAILIGVNEEVINKSFPVRGLM